MKCMVCENYSLTHICKSCQNIYLTPIIYKRDLLEDITVISFYKYDEIKDLLHTKHTDLGYYIFNILAQNSFLKFAQEFKYTQKLTSIPIDDNVLNNYSHTAILNKHLKSPYIHPVYNRLRATNHINYSGKSKLFRIQNPRNFTLNKLPKNDVILVDDIITTGSTLTQAIELLKKNKINVLFCLTLCDLRNR